MTTSLEVSKELWERGLRVGSYFYWTKDIHDGDFPDIDYMVAPFKYGEVDIIEYPAYLLHELLEVMPSFLPLDGQYLSLTLQKGEHENNKYKCIYLFEGSHFQITKSIDLLEGGSCHFDTNPADAVAKCLIYLIDNEYCKVVDGNITTGEQDD